MARDEVEATELSGGERRQNVSCRKGWSGISKQHRRSRGKNTKQRTCRSETGGHIAMMGRRHTHYHITKQNSEDPPSRPTLAMENYFMNMNSVVNASVTCIAVKEDRHQNITSIVPWKQGVEEPWTLARVARFIDLLDHSDTTLKSDSEPVILALRKSVAEQYKESIRHNRGCSQ